MKVIPLTQGKFTIVDDDDYEELIKYNWQFHHGYAKTGVKTVQMHRYIVKALPDQDVDHINRNRLDNRKINLRIATEIPKKPRRNNTSGQKGVNYFKPRKCWVARLQMNGKRYYLGGFLTREDAIMAYRKAEREYKD